MISPLLTTASRDAVRCRNWDRFSSSSYTMIPSRNTGTMMRRVTSCVQCWRRETHSWMVSEEWLLHAPKEAAIPSEACSLGEAVMSLIADERTRQLFHYKGLLRSPSHRLDVDRQHVSWSGWHVASRASHEPAVGGRIGTGFWRWLWRREWIWRWRQLRRIWQWCWEWSQKDYISEVSESSLWASIRHYLTPSDILVFRTAGSQVE